MNVTAESGTAEDAMNDMSDSLQQGYGPPNRWRLLSLVALAYFVLIQHRLVIGYVQVPLTSELGLSDSESGMLDTAFLIPYGISQLFVAYLSDRLQRRRVLAVSLLASSVCLFAMGFVGGFWQLAGLRVLLGFGQSASVPAIAGVMADCFTPKNRSTAVGIYNLSLNLAVVVVGTLGGGLADLPNLVLPFEMLGVGELSGWRLALLVFGVTGALASLLIAVVMSEPERTERKSSQGLGQQGAGLMATVLSVLKLRTFVLLAIVFGGFCVVDNAQNYWLARHYVEDFGMTNADAGFFATIYYRPAAFLGLLVGGFVADRWARRWVRGRMLVQILGITLWIPALGVLGIAESRFVLAPTMVVIGLGYGFYVANLWTTSFDVIDPAARSTAIGLFNVIAVPAAFTSPFIGYLRDTHGVELGQAISGLSIVACLIVLALSVTAIVFLPRDYHGPLAVEKPVA